MTESVGPRPAEPVLVHELRARSHDRARLGPRTDLGGRSGPARVRGSHQGQRSTRRTHRPNGWQQPRPPARNLEKRPLQSGRRPWMDHPKRSRRRKGYFLVAVAAGGRPGCPPAARAAHLWRSGSGPRISRRRPGAERIGAARCCRAEPGWQKTSSSSSTAEAMLDVRGSRSSAPAVDPRRADPRLSRRRTGNPWSGSGSAGRRPGRSGSSSRHRRRCGASGRHRAASP